jgi:hypothetical protein
MSLLPDAADIWELLEAAVRSGCVRGERPDESIDEGDIIAEAN